MPTILLPGEFCLAELAIVIEVVKVLILFELKLLNSLKILDI